MAVRHGEYERLRGVLERADEPLTAREVLEALDDPEIGSPHRVATILGRHAGPDGDVEVRRGQPYRYQV